MNIKDTLRKWGNSTFTHMLSSFILMGGWAFFANRSHAMPAPLYAGLLQGLLSAVITLGLKKSFEAVFGLWHARGKGRMGVFFTPLMVCTVSASTLLACHALAGTPELIATIIVPSSVALIYGYIYTYTMWRQAR